MSTNYGQVDKDNNVIQVCMNGTYKWEVVGLFSTEEILIYNYTEPFALSAVSINFRLFTTRDVNFLLIKVNKLKVYESHFNTGATR